MANQLTVHRPSRLAPWFRRDPLLALGEEMEDLVSRFWGEESDNWPIGRLCPCLDLSESASNIEVRLDVPGAKPEDFDIQISGNLLTISGERKEEKEEKGRTWHRAERRTGSFSRSISLPCRVEEDKVQAEYRDGVLTVTLPKSEEAKAHKIAIKS